MFREIICEIKGVGGTKVMGTKKEKGGKIKNGGDF